MNLFTQQVQTHKLTEWTYGCQGVRLGGEVVKEVWDWLVQSGVFKSPARSHCIAQGILLSMQPGWEGILGKIAHLLSRVLLFVTPCL